MSVTAKGGTRIEAVMAAIKRRISSRSLLQGDKLPSIRLTARQMQVSVSTVVVAYDRLSAEGTIVSRPGAGFYIAGQTLPLSVTAVGPRLEKRIDPFWVSRQSLETPGTDLKPGCGWLPPSWLPEESMRRALRALSRADGAILADYSAPLGSPALCQIIRGRIEKVGIETSAKQIMLMDSGTQAIDLLCRFLLEPGDTVLVDDPCYFNFNALLRAHRAKIVSVPFTTSGPDIEQLEGVLKKHRPRLYITNSGIHNPTGASLLPSVAHRVLSLAEQYDLTILEDDIFADFEHIHAPRLAAIDGLNRVVHLGSFSKTISGSIRCGYVCARPDWIEKLIDLKIATSFGGNNLAAELVLNVLRDGGYRKHLEKLKLRLSHAMRDVNTRLKSIGITPWHEPKAGMFLWSQLPEGADAANVAQKLLEENIVLAPGNVFSVSQSATRFMRFNVSQCQDARVFDALQKALLRG